MKWKVDEPPTGRYRSFFKRHWPTCHVKGRTAFHIIPVNGDEYNAKAMVPLKVQIAVWRKREGDHPTFDWKTLKGEATGLAEAKAKAKHAFDAGLNNFKEVFDDPL
jgi:hypothetical protein